MLKENLWRDAQSRFVLSTRQLFESVFERIKMVHSVKYGIRVIVFPSRRDFVQSVLIVSDIGHRF